MAGIGKDLERAKEIAGPTPMIDHITDLFEGEPEQDNGDDFKMKYTKPHKKDYYYGKH